MAAEVRVTSGSELASSSRARPPPRPPEGKSRGSRLCSPRRSLRQPARRLGFATDRRAADAHPCPFLASRPVIPSQKTLNRGALIPAAFLVTTGGRKHARPLANVSELHRQRAERNHSLSCRRSSFRPLSPRLMTDVVRHSSGLVRQGLVRSRLTSTSSRRPSPTTAERERPCKMCVGRACPTPRRPDCPAARDGSERLLLEHRH